MALAASAVISRATPASARGRTPTGGQIALQIPFAVASVDPHRLDDPAAALLGEALFDGLYAAGPADADTAAVIAEGAPEPAPGGRGLRISIRKGLRTAHGRHLDARDVVFSIERARARGARGWLAEIPVPRLSGHDGIIFAVAAVAAADAAKLVRALSSPLVSIVPSSFSAATPDGTGPFRAEVKDGEIVLARNPLAARGGSFLAQATVRAAPDLSASLRAFETTTDDLGWLGMGLHEPRPGARRFDGGAVAWAILATGSEAGTWDQPGVAQALADGVPHARVSTLGVGEAWPDRGGAGWGGSPCALFVRSDSPWLVELSSVVAAALTRPGHEVVSRPVPAAELVHRRETRGFSLAIDVARPFLGPAGSPSATTPAEVRAEATLAALLGLTTADDPRIAEGLGRHPPRLADGRARSLTRTLRVGVLGEIRAQGGRAADLVLPTSASGAGFDLGSAYRLRGGG
jgi:peptide/nickel transport system substrate-binding protein